MKVSLTDQTADLANAQSKPGAEQLRNAAVQFEAILLTQITSALSGSGGDDEDALFGSDAGSGLAQRMFAEQMATTLAQSGGFGISDLIMKQIGGEDGVQKGGIKGLSEIISNVKSLKDSNTTGSVRPLESRTHAAISSVPAPAADNGEVQIISTFEDDLRTNGIDEATKNLMMDGRVLNSTRARIVPGAPVISMNDAVGEESREIEFQRPLSGRISSTFGTRFHPVDRTTKFHGGVDIAVPTGTQVSAAAEGTISFAGRKGGYGNLVVIDHPDGRQTRYGHLASIAVSAGDEVGKGQPIALSGSTGKSTGPHLHFEMRENGRAVDPMRILSNVLPKNAER